MKRVFHLMGGVQSFDGVVTSAGMRTLNGMLKSLPDVVVKNYLWSGWMTAYRDVMSVTPEDKIILIGYSGGGVHITWIARGYTRKGPANDPRAYVAKPKWIDLLVAYDPSPKDASLWLEDNVRRVICYHNTNPMMFGLGGEQIKGACNVQQVDISQQHLMVQFNTELHRRTFNAIRDL